MARFRYRALAPSGELTEGRLSADSKDAAFDLLRRRGVVPLDAYRVEGSASGQARLVWRGRENGDRALVVLTRELSVLLSAGLTVDRALDSLIRARPKGALQAVLKTASASLKGGSSLGKALAEHSNTFPPFYCALIQAGERSGDLPAVLNQLAESLERRAALKEKVRSALLYPAIVLALISVTFVILMVWVIPQFRPILEGHDLPLNAQIVLGLSSLTLSWGWLALLVLAILALLLERLARRDAVILSWHKRLLSLPKVGSVARELDVARYCRSLSILVGHRVPLPEATEIAAGTLSNRSLAGALAGTRAALARGESLNQALKNSGQMPDTIIQLVAIGEDSGRLAEMLALAADTAEAESQRSIETLMTLLVPTVTIVLGVLVALVIGSILSAILSSYNVPI